jgi:hypothetical protein
MSSLYSQRKEEEEKEEEIDEIPPPEILKNNLSLHVYSLD